MAVRHMSTSNVHSEMTGLSYGRDGASRITRLATFSSLRPYDKPCIAVYVSVVLSSNQQTKE